MALPSADTVHVQDSLAITYMFLQDLRYRSVSELCSSCLVANFGKLQVPKILLAMSDQVGYIMRHGQFPATKVLGNPQLPADTRLEIRHAWKACCVGGRTASAKLSTNVEKNANHWTDICNAAFPGRAGPISAAVNAHGRLARGDGIGNDYSCNPFMFCSMLLYAAGNKKRCQANRRRAGRVTRDYCDGIFENDRVNYHVITLPTFGGHSMNATVCAGNVDIRPWWELICRFYPQLESNYASECCKPDALIVSRDVPSVGSLLAFLLVCVDRDHILERVVLALAHQLLAALCSNMEALIQDGSAQIFAEAPDPQSMLERKDRAHPSRHAS